MADILVAAILIVIALAAVYKLISDKKKGIGSCGCGCDSCSYGCSCGDVPDRFRLKK